MKILHVLNSNKYSGAENVVCQIINMFAFDTNVEMVYCSPDGPIRENLEEYGIPFAPMTALSGSELKRVINEQKPDVIHAHDFRASMIAASASKKIPVISHLHNNCPWLKSFGIKTVAFAASCGKYSRILTVSDSVFDEFIFGKRFKDKVVVVGNPINTANVIERSEMFEEANNYDIGFLGRLTEQKNPSLLLDIIKEVKRSAPDIRVAIVGDGELRADFEAKLRDLGLADCVTMYGFQKNPYPIIKKCRVLLMPSLWEGFGLASVEALTLGLPVICSGAGGLSDIVNDSCGKICKDLDEYVAEVIAMQDNDYYARKSEQAKARARELDNYSSYKAQIREVYSKLKAR